MPISHPDSRAFRAISTRSGPCSELFAHVPATLWEFRSKLNSATTLECLLRSVVFALTVLCRCEGQDLPSGIPGACGRELRLAGHCSLTRVRGCVRHWETHPHACLWFSRESGEVIQARMQRGQRKERRARIAAAAVSCLEIMNKLLPFGTSVRKAEWSM